MTALDDLFAVAAEARSAGVRAHADRPSQRRAAEDRGSLAVVGARSALVLRDAPDPDAGALHFTGFATVYNRGYEMWDMFGPYTEQVLSGAGAKSLANPALDVPLVLSHDSMRRIARTTNGTLSLAETVDGDTEGLKVDAPALDPTDADVAYIAPKLRAGLIDEMSFRFRITFGEWSPDWMEYHIAGYDINRGDVAIVGYGANPYTAGSGLRESLADLTERQLSAKLDALYREHQRRGLIPVAFSGIGSVPLPEPVIAETGGNSLGITRASLALDV